ncbi:MAG: hypothetical protein JNM66_16235 [Bryobacterales bacterium]|nr:hypothetical protein [Bryobacterales bacterium]
MTKVQRHYELLRPLDGTLLKRISDAHGIYGFQRIEVAPSLDKILVEYDASRLTRGGVEAKLHGAGIPVKPV